MDLEWVRSACGRASRLARSAAVLWAVGILVAAPGASSAQAPQGPDALQAVEEWPVDDALPDFVPPVAATSAADAEIVREEVDQADAQPAAFDPFAPEGGYRSEIEKAWFGAGRDPRARAIQARARALEMGARSEESAARALMHSREAAPDSVDAEDFVRLARNLPAAHLAVARVKWEEGERQAALVSLGAGLWAIPRHLEASLWFVSSLLVMAVAIVLIGTIAFIVAVGCSVFRHAAHDLGDVLSRSTPAFARFALLGSLVLVPLVLGEGLLGLVLAMFAVGFLYGESSHRMALTLAAALLVVGLYPMGRFATTALEALEADPVAAAALSVARGIESEAEIERLEQARSDDLLARYTLAIRAQRRGDFEAARSDFEALLENDPANYVLLTHLGNLHFRTGETEQAIGLYERAIALVDSPVLLFDLAQAYAREFRMEEYESAMKRAQSLDQLEVAELSRSGDTQFVADLPHPMAPIRKRLVSVATGGGGAMTGAIVELLAPGWVGTSWMTVAGSFCTMALFATLLAGRFNHASRCKQCGRRICNRCDGTVWSSETCEGCYRLFNRPETTDAALRMARLKELRAREQRNDRVATVASILVPGVGGLLARRPDLGFLGIVLFVGAAVALVGRHGVVPDPLAVGAAGPLVFSIVGMTALFSYLVVVAIGLFARRSL